MDFKDWQRSTGSNFGNLARGAASRLGSLFSKADKSRMKNKIDKATFDNVAKPLSDLSRKAGSYVSDTPILGKAFKTQTGKDSIVEPISKAKNVALPMLAATGLAKVVNDRRKAKKQKIDNKIQENVTQLKGGQNKMANVSPKMLEKTAAHMEKLAAKNQELEEQIQKRKETFQELTKLAQSERIPWEEVPEMLEKLAGLEEDEYKVEMKVLKKTASNEFLNIGDISKGSSDGGVRKAEDLFTKFVNEHGRI